jgi:hypothetical protein
MIQLKSLVFFTFLGLSLIVSGQDKDELFIKFLSDDWKLVKSAKTELENLEAEIIPDLIVMLENNKFADLQNTGSLIYPGAEKFFGHGQILDYDIDYLAIRAGWLLEDITFNNFGFTGIHLPKEDALDFIKITFSDYYNNSVNRKKLESADKKELRAIILKLAIDKAENWWNENKKFTRLDGLVGALQSFDERRQVKALFYMRNGTTKCSGLTTEFYDDKLIKEVSRLSRSNVKRISEHAKLIMLDSSLDWLKMKKQ